MPISFGSEVRMVPASLIFDKKGVGVFGTSCITGASCSGVKGGLPMTEYSISFR